MAIRFSRLAAVLGVSLGLAAAVTACTASATTSVGTGTGATTTPATVSFKSDVAPLLKNTCAGCHAQGGMGSNDLVIFDASNEVSHANVSGDIARIVQQTQSGRMPQGRTKLTAAQLAILTSWQSAGTPNN